MLRKIFLSNVFVVVCTSSPSLVFSQVSPPAPYTSGAAINFVRSWDAKAPQTDLTTITFFSPVDSFLMTTRYVDGLGRPIETVSKQTSPLRNDMVTPVLYDGFGREQYKYLPFVANSTGGNSSITDGGFKLNPFQEQANFYSDPNSVIKGQGETYFYGQSQFEASPLNRVLATYAPGNSWVGGGRGTQSQYTSNTAADSVRIWTVDYNIPTLPVTASTYAAGTLYKTVSTDEQTHQVVEYKDFEGRVVLKKVQLSNSPGSAHVGWLNTYYIYDDLGNLRFVLQPRAVELLLAQGNWILAAPLRDELCFYYHYDARNRMCFKKVPGAGMAAMVYDSKDRLVMTQDSLLRAQGKWLVTEYDTLDRPYRTGLLTDGNSQSYHQNLAWDKSTYPNTSANYEVLTQTGYDDYTTLPAGAASSTLDGGNINGTNFYTSYNAAPRYEQQIAQSTQTKGAVTWTKTEVVASGGAQYLYSTHIYDEKGRLIQLKSTNVTGGIDVVTTQYDFSGKVLKTHVSHQKSGANAHTYQVLTTTSYDHGGRVLTIAKRTSMDAALGSTDKIIVQNSYDELGQLKSKTLGSSIEILSYEYNIRGWLLGANRAFAKDTTSTTNYFGFDLGYDKKALTVNGTSQAYTAAQYNGNIGGMLWKSRGDQQTRKYDFTYDNVNRLTGAGFTQFNSGSFSLSGGIDYSVSGLSYDANGNILTLNQKGWTLPFGSKTVDSLRYTYIGGNTNKLQSVVDYANDTATRLGDFRSSKVYMTALGNNKTTAAVDYAYDGNGNLIKDLNKDMQAGAITYNYLNLPAVITVQNKGTIQYTYDAGGNKLKKVVTDNSVSPAKVTTTLYLIGNFVNDTLQFLPQEEGRVRLRTSDNTFQWDYFLKDHLGNVRMVLTEEQKTDAYPPASLETTQLSTERLYYSKVDSARVDRTTISGYPTTDTYTSPNTFVQKLNGSATKVGTGIVLKVMAGDKFNIRVSDWWRSNGVTPGTTNSPLNDLISVLSSSVAPLATGKATSTELQGSGAFNSQVNSFLSSRNYTTTKPKAYVNWVLFDEQFKYVASSSGFEQVGGDNPATVTVHTRTNLPVDKSGYLYVFVSNETTNLDVFFDNLQVTHIRGPLLEETHYYPFGLTMAGISARAAGGLLNRCKFNDGTELSNQEFSDGSGLELYETPSRGYDTQIGRFWQIDAMASDYEAWSPYVFSFNNPINLNDPSGLATDSLKAPDNEMVADKGNMEAVTIKYSPKSKQNYTWWTLYVDARQGSDYWEVYNNLKNQGVNERGLRLFNLAWQGIGYRKQLAEIEAGWREFVEDALIESGTWVVGGVAFKAVSVGFRMYKLSRAANAIRVFWNTGGRGGNVLIKVAAENFARINGGMTVNMTLSGRALEFVSPILPKSISTPLWNRLSSSFARNAIGEIHVFQNATSGVNAASTWVKYEFSNLNLSRVSINYHY
jgi:RHS repeat-associated protein